MSGINEMDSPLSLYMGGREMLETKEKKNEVLAEIAGEEYDRPTSIPKGVYAVQKRLLKAAQDEVELLESIAEGGGGPGGGGANALDINYATDVLSLKKNGEAISGSGVTLPGYGLSYDSATGGLTMTKNGAPMTGQTVALPPYGAPQKASTAADMTDRDSVYVYVGEESGYTAGDWYYYDDTLAAWVSGGVYNSAAVVTDKTLAVEDVPADAKAVGEGVRENKEDIGELKTQVKDDLYISNNFSWENGNISATGANNNTNRQYRVRTVGFVQDSSIEMLRCPSDSMFVVHMYSEQSTSNWVGVWTGTQFATSSGAWVKEFDFGKYQALYPTYYFRFVLQKDKFTEIAPSYGKNLYVVGYDSVDSKIAFSIAKDFNQFAAYFKGDYCYYKAELYTFVSDKTEGAWDSTKVKKVVLTDELRVSNKFEWENGNIGATGKNNTTNADYRVRTVGFIQDNTIEMLSCPADTMFAVHMYSGQSESDWVSVFNGTSFAETGGAWIGEFDFGRWQAVYPTYYFRFVMQKRTFTEIGPSYGKYLYISGYDSIDLKILNGIASDFNQFGTYSVGDYCYYHTVLYRFIADKPAGAWDDTKVNPVSIITDMQIAAVNVDKKAVYDKFCTHFNTGGDVSSYIFFTDPHIYNKNCSDSLIKKMFSVIQNAYNSTPTDFVMCGGDWLVGRKNDIIPDGPTPAQACGQLGFLAGVTDKLFKPYYPIIGNHDTNYKNTTLSQQTINNLMFRGQGESYYRFEAKDVAYYVFDSGLDNDTDTITPRRAAQLDWFATALLTEAKPNVAICTHIFYATTTGVWSLATVSKMGEYMAAIAAAYNARQNYSAGWDNTKSYDYSGKTGKVDYIIAGHLHHDWIVQESGIPVVMTIWVLNNYTDPTFDLMAYDHDADTLYCDRIGAGANRIIHCNQETVTTTKTLTATITGTLTWTSDSTDVATVSDGMVTAVASGYSLITAANENGEIETWIVSVS